MAAAFLPHISDIRSFNTRLYDEFHIEIPCLDWDNSQLIRISVQGYNALEDIDALLNALELIIPETQNRW